MSRKAWPPSKSGRLIVIPHWVPSTRILLTVRIVDVADDKVSPSLRKATYWCGPDSYLSGSVTVLNGSSIAVSTIICVFYKAVSVLLSRMLIGLAQAWMLLISRGMYERTCKGLPGLLQQLLQPYLRTSLILKPLARGVIRGGFLLFFLHLLLPQTLLHPPIGRQAQNSASSFLSWDIFRSCSYIRHTTESLVMINILIFQFFFLRGHVLAATRVWWLIKETWVISVSVFTETPFCISSQGNMCWLEARKHKDNGVKIIVFM